MALHHEGYWGVDGEARASSVPRNRARNAVKYNFARICLCWMDSLFWHGCKRGRLDHSDLYSHPDEADSEKLLNKFNRYWSWELQRHRSGRNARLWFPIIKCLWWRSLIQGGCYLGEAALQVLKAVVLGYLVAYYSEEDPSQQETQLAYVYATGIFVMAVFGGLLLNGFLFIGKKVSMMARIILSGAVYQKVLTLDQVTLGRVTTGRIINLLSIDVYRFDHDEPYFPHHLWSAPLMLLINISLIYVHIGLTAIVVMTFTILQLPVHITVGRCFAKLRLKAAVHTDVRVKVMSEVICGIRVIKMYGWEYAFKQAVSRLRKKESVAILKSLAIRACQQAYATVSVTVLAYATFVTYTVSGGDLTPQKLFTVLALLYNLRTGVCLGYVTAVLNMFEANVAVQRIQAFLLENEPATNLCGVSNRVYKDSAEQIENEEGPWDISSNDSTSTQPAESYSPRMHVDGVSASWGGLEERPTLNNIHCEVTKDHPLLIVCGSVGCGKSSLLQCILGELKPKKGSVDVEGTISYASQEPWVFSGTLRDNILFGQHFHQDWYNTIITACSLDQDISLLEHGDQTLIGERGVTLSGGQKARVNLARAVYRLADIYLLDDPLSAVDTKVAKHLFERVICGVLQDKLVVLVTHQVQFAEKGSRILAIVDGNVEAYGTPAELESGGVKLLGLMNDDMEDTNEFAVREEKRSDPKPMQGTPRLGRSLKRRNILHGVELDRASMYSARSMMSIQSIGDYDSEEPVLQQEQRKRGGTSMRIYLNFFRAGASYPVLFVVFLVFITAQVATVSADWWLSDWVNCEDKNTTVDSTTCSVSTSNRIFIYTGLMVFAVITNFLRTITFYAVCLNASRVLHNRMFAAILRVPVRFYDTNPTGRILNRFSKDQGFLDDIIPYQLCESLLWITHFLAILLTSVVANIWLLIPLLGICVLVVLFQWYYLKTAREVKRLEAVARSPFYSHISTTIQGLPTIRAFGKEPSALRLFHKYQNEHTQGWWLYLAGSEWFTIRLEVLTLTLIAAVVFSSVPLSSELDASLLSLSLLYMLSLLSYFEYCVRLATELETLMVSVERVMEYSHLESEASLETIPPEKKPPDNWPTDGRIEVNGVSFRYADDLPMVLKDLSFVIHPSEKVGVVGRTGAGKSSLLSVLFRMAEYFGVVTIDGVSVKEIGLHDLRSRLSVIPQDPVLFSGTVRYNLDPFTHHTDQELWTALQRVHLKLVVMDMDGQLQAEVSEEGGNFSVGQRQLMCLARALLRKNQIIVLDEATANVDIKTDDVIQATIREHFSKCTVITIAHRLNTVMDSDKILVMSKGEVVEFDSPYTLLQNPRSQFRKMVDQTGPSASRKLHQMAADARKIRV